MNRNEHILTVIAEEANEIGQRVSKALRFGLEEAQPGQEFNNADRIVHEVEDLIGAYLMAVQEGLLPALDFHPAALTRMEARKRGRVERYMSIGKRTGALT